MKESFAGNGTKGVTLGKHADILLKSFYNDGYEQCWVVVYKVYTHLNVNWAVYIVAPDCKTLCGSSVSDIMGNTYLNNRLYNWILHISIGSFTKAHSSRNLNILSCTFVSRIHTLVLKEGK